MCRYTCSCCNWCNVHKVLSFELIERQECTPYIKIEVSNPTACDGNFFCLKFRNIPIGLTSYPIVVVINDEEVPVATRCGRVVTSADLCPCTCLSGMFCNDKLIVTGV